MLSFSLKTYGLNICFFMMFFHSIIAFSDESSFDNLVRKGGIWLEKSTDSPFTGKMKGLMLGFSRGCKGCKTYGGRLVEGKPQGKWDYFHDNGQLYQSKVFKNGKLNGKFVSYYYDGGLCQKGEYKSGKIIGEWERYNKNGTSWITNDRSPECDMCLCSSEQSD